MVMLRRGRRFCSVHNRYLAICIRNLKRAKKLKRVMIVCALAIEMLFDDQDEYNEDNEEDIEDILVVFQVMLLRHRRLISHSS